MPFDLDCPPAEPEVAVPGSNSSALEITIMTRRPGMSLTEVLVALFIVALGVIGILTMFPLGAAQMALAVRDDRSAQAAVSADGFMRAFWVSNILPPNNASAERFFAAMDNPNEPGPVIPTIWPQPNASANPPEWSYPVVVDPIGWAARSGLPSQTLLGDGGSTLVPRRTISILSNPNDPNANLFAFRTCSLLDNHEYADNGVPGEFVNGSPTGRSNRELRYNWLWVIQRPIEQNTFAVNMTVVVFDRRAALFAPTGAESVVSGVQFNPFSTSVQIPLNASQQVPELKQGMWVMDATVSPLLPPPNPTGIRRTGLRHANFYRVVSATPDPLQPVLNLELQTPIGMPTDNNAQPYLGSLVVLRGVSGVFVRPQLPSH